MPRVRRCKQIGCHNIVTPPKHYCDVHKQHEAEYAERRTYYHSYNQVKRKDSNDKRKRYAFYRSRVWQALRLNVLERDYHLCQYCKLEGVVNEGNTVDHTIPIEFDESRKADVNNLAVICPACHKLKTNWEHSYYGTGDHATLRNVPVIEDLGMVNRLMRLADNKI